MQHYRHEAPAQRPAAEMPREADPNSGHSFTSKGRRERDAAREGLSVDPIRPLQEFPTCENLAPRLRPNAAEGAARLPTPAHAPDAGPAPRLEERGFQRPYQEPPSHSIPNDAELPREFAPEQQMEVDDEGDDEEPEESITGEGTEEEKAAEKKRARNDAHRRRATANRKRSKKNGGKRHDPLYDPRFDPDGDGSSIALYILDPQEGLMPPQHQLEGGQQAVIFPHILGTEDAWTSDKQSDARQDSTAVMIACVTMIVFLTMGWLLHSHGTRSRRLLRNARSLRHVVYIFVMWSMTLPSDANLLFHAPAFRRSAKSFNPAHFKGTMLALCPHASGGHAARPGHPTPARRSYHIFRDDRARSL